MILSNYSDRQSPQFRILSDAHCRELYLAALECLARVGVIVNHEEARHLLAGAGAQVEGNLVRIPAHIIQEALTVIPRTFTIWGRERRNEMQVNPDKAFFGPGPTCTYFIDPDSGKRRRARRGDAGLTARVCDALPNIDYVMGLSLYDDVTPVLAPVYEFADMLTNTTKPVLAWANSPETVHDIYEIALAEVGSEAQLQRYPRLGFFGTYESPLRHPQTALANMLTAVELGLPVIYIGGPTVGLESPFTGASALVIHLASALSAIAIVQLKRRGAPMVIGGVLSAMDLRSARPAYGSPESSLNIAAAMDVARYLNVPFMGTAGASESKLLDGQAGLEATFQLVTSALSGASLVHDLGFLDCADIGSLAYLVVADEILGMVKRFMRGIQVSHETIMLDLIEQIGPGGSYLMETRSATMCRVETWVPTILDRQPYLAWDEGGGADLEARASKRVAKILATHQIEPLPTEIVSRMDAVLAEAEIREAQNR